MSLRLQHFDDFDALAAHAAAWDALVAASDADPCFMRWAWVEAWWRAFGEPGALATTLLWDGPRLVGIVPLARRRKEGFRQLVLLGAGRSDYQDLVLHPDHVDAGLHAVLHRVLPELPGWDVLHCTRLLEGRATTAGLARALAGQRRYRWQLRPHDVAPAVALDGAWDDYEATAIKRRIVKDTARQRRRLEREHGPVAFQHARTEDDVLDWFDRLTAFHRVRRDVVKGDYSMFNDPACTAFYRDAALASWRDGTLHLTRLLVADDVAAIHLGFVAGGTYYYMLPVLNDAYERYSVGRLLLFELLRESHDCGYRRFDFGYGDEAYKADFAPERRTMHGLVLARDTARGAAAYWWFDGLRETVRDNAFIMERVLPRLKARGLVAAGA